MKKQSFIFPAVLLVLVSFSTQAQKTYKGLPVIKASTNKADYKLGNELVKGSWSIMPEVAPDVLTIPANSKTNFVFYTNLDSIRFTIKPGKSEQFYVLLNGKDYALTEIKGEKTESVSFANSGTAQPYKFVYETNPNSGYLKTLREKYKLEDLVKNAKTDAEKALLITNWVHKQWKHNGNNQPRKSDALSILEEVKEGKNFRCVEYGIVATAALNSIGLHARTLALKTKDVETRSSGAGHVLVEVYLNDLQKWALLDGQFDVMPVLNKVPLNAVELQHAITYNFDKLEIKSLSGTGKRRYIYWVFPYLYYFDVKFDNREGTNLKRELVNGKSSLMLVPAGAKNPTIFQGKWPITNCLYTNSVADFYQAPTL